MQNSVRATIGLIGVACVAGCSGGGGSAYAAPKPVATATAPVAGSNASTDAAPLSTATIDGGSAFVTASDLPVYEFSSDTNDHSNCTGGCLTTWPAVPAPNATLPSPFSSFTRSDDGLVQLAYNGAPLYTFSGDSPGVANGENFEGFTLARPLATPAASAAPMPPGGYERP